MSMRVSVPGYASPRYANGGISFVEPMAMPLTARVFGGSFTEGMQLSSVPVAGQSLQAAPLQGGSMSMPVAVPAISGVCGYIGCQNAARFTCGGCGVKLYCSAACQQKDWPEHKLQCKAAAKGSAPQTTQQVAQAPQTARQASQPFVRTIGTGASVQGRCIQPNVVLPETGPEGRCGNPSCLRPATLRCSQCGQKAYCSVACQLKDWPEHKALCDYIAKNNIDNGPNPFTPYPVFRVRRAIPAKTKYLPKVVNGTPVLREVSTDVWQTMNNIGASTLGLGLRGSKTLNSLIQSSDVHERLVFWGATVQGIDEGDGWVRVGDADE